MKWQGVFVAHLRGLDTMASAGLAAAIGDLSRFASAPRMSYSPVDAGLWRSLPANGCHGRALSMSAAGLRQSQACS